MLDHCLYLLGVFYQLLQTVSSEFNQQVVRQHKAIPLLLCRTVHLGTAHTFAYPLHQLLILRWKNKFIFMNLPISLTNFINNKFILFLTDNFLLNLPKINTPLRNPLINQQISISNFTLLIILTTPKRLLSHFGRIKQQHILIIKLVPLILTILNEWIIMTTIGWTCMHHHPLQFIVEVVLRQLFCCVALLGLVDYWVACFFCELLLGVLL